MRLQQESWAVAHGCAPGNLLHAGLQPAPHMCPPPPGSVLLAGMHGNPRRFQPLAMGGAHIGEAEHGFKLHASSGVMPHAPAGSMHHPPIGTLHHASHGFMQPSHVSLPHHPLSVSPPLGVAENARESGLGQSGQPSLHGLSLPRSLPGTFVHGNMHGVSHPDGLHAASLPNRLPQARPSALPPFPTDRARTWCVEPRDALADGDALGARPLGLMPSVSSSASSTCWRLDIGQAHSASPLPVAGSPESEQMAEEVIDAVVEQWQLSASAEGIGRLQHKAGSPNFAVVLQLKGPDCAAANGLLKELTTSKALHVRLPSGVHVTIPATDYGATRSLGAVRILMQHVDPLAVRPGITAAVLGCAGYDVTGKGATSVRVLSEQAGAPRHGGLADITTVVAFVIPPADDPHLLRLPPAFVDYADNTTCVLLSNDRPPPRHPRRDPFGSSPRQPAAPPSSTHSAILLPAGSPLSRDSAVSAARQAFHATRTAGAATLATAPSAARHAASAGSPKPVQYVHGAPPAVIPASSSLPARSLPGSPEVVEVPDPVACKPHPAPMDVESDEVVAAVMPESLPFVEPCLASSSLPELATTTRGRSRNRAPRSHRSRDRSRSSGRTLPQPLHPPSNSAREPASVDSALAARPPSPHLAVSLAYRSRFVPASEPIRLNASTPTPMSEPESSDSGDEEMGSLGGDPCLPLPPEAPTLHTGASPASNLYPVSNGKDTHPGNVGSGSYLATDTGGSHVPPTRPAAADFGNGYGYSLGGSAARQARMLASGPAPMQEVQDSRGAVVVPEHHKAVLDASGACAIVPEHQLASAPPITAKRSPHDRRGIGATPEYDSWLVRDVIVTFIANTYTDGLSKAGAPSALECALTVLRNHATYWRNRSSHTSLDSDMRSRVDGHMRFVLGEVRGPRPVLHANLLLKAPTPSGQRGRKAPNPASPSPSISAPADSPSTARTKAGPRGGGGGVAL